MRGAKPAPSGHTVPAIMAPDKYTLRPTDLGSPKNDYIFRFNGHDVGRTYADGTPVGPRWYWSIDGINLRGPQPAGVTVQGLADDLAAAKAAFKENLIRPCTHKRGTSAFAAKADVRWSARNFAF